MITETLSTEAIAQPHVIAQASPLVKGFLDYLKYEKHFSDYTVRSYGADLIQFCQYLRGEIGAVHRNNALKTEGSTDDQICAADTSVFREFLTYLYAQNYTKSTTARKLATLR